MIHVNAQWIWHRFYTAAIPFRIHY
jgi:hypothetical protein